MSLVHAGSRPDLISNLEHHAREHAAPDEQEVFVAFLRHYFESTPLTRLQAHGARELVAMAYSHWHFARRRRSGESLVRVFNPTSAEHGWTGPFTVIETTTDDAPFLVDSVSMAVRAEGSSIDWISHPVFEVQRDESGLLTAVDTSDGHAESWIHMQFDALADADARAALVERVQRVLQDLKIIVRDWQPMRRRLQALADEPGPLPDSALASQQREEVCAFLRWLDADHFTFLGYRTHKAVRDTAGNAHLEPVAGSGLGLLSDRQPDPDMEGFVAPEEYVSEWVESPRPLVITKGNSRSPVHHPEYMDVIAIKQFDNDGRVTDTHRFVGLFTSEVYTDNPRNIPVLRRKMDHVLARSHLRPNSHAAKNLVEILETLPREELFQSNEDALLDTAMEILDLRDRERVRLFVRRDRYGRYYYCMVYVPRDQYAPELRDRVRQVLLDNLDGYEVETEEQFLLRGMARILFTVHTQPGHAAALNKADLEEKVIAAARGWKDHLRDALIARNGTEVAAALLSRFRDGLPLSYTESTSPEEATADLRLLARVEASDDLALRVAPDVDGRSNSFRLKMYVGSGGLTLSDVLPMLERFGVRVLGQRPHRIQTRDGGTVWIEEFYLHHATVAVSSSRALCNRFEMAFTRTWRGQIENDGFNSLVLDGGLHWRQVVLVRALCKYLLQTPLPLSQAYMQQLVARHADITGRLVRLFETRFDPRIATAEREARMSALEQEITGLFDDVSSLDADRLLRALLSVVRAAVRTNFYQKDENHQRKPYISIKVASGSIEELPRPRPLYETFIYSPAVEGVHLRGGKVSRGGIRWSDRREDFRTEVLGLMKAQMVKNAVIVPVGAKGGFVVKGLPANVDRETRAKAGVACYQTFMRGLLDITDNLVEGECVPPRGVVRHDDDDPYLVVAADKGTASFSDIANGIAAEYGYWLGDAFASGGSHGYDHKKMGITARGGWESVKRHFLEMGRDTQREPFTAIGIGDMAGDVFGNGMLQSPCIRLIAAFNHLHIFIDPDPDPETSYAERKRLFELPRSAWSDYDDALISAGGGVFSRSAKQIHLSPQARQALDIRADTLTPAQLIREILKAPVDLLWNGGIGTYVKASTESDAEIGDRGNDALRIDGRELRCKVVGEGGNLGFSQRGRIEYALRGGRINTDFIDNSAGVDCSDHEVNIKIALNEPLGRGELSGSDRDSLLEAMTEDVAALVLRDNVLQTQAISLIHRAAAARLDEHVLLMRILERSGLLDRGLEALPDQERLAERRARSQGLTRPEIATLFAYAKLDLYHRIVASPLPDDDYLDTMLLEAFPRRLQSGFRDALGRHRLRRDIIATALANALVNRLGMAFAHRLADEADIGFDRIAWAFVAARDVLELQDLWARMDALEGAVAADVLYGLFERMTPLLSHAIPWFLNNVAPERSLSEAIAAYAGDVRTLNDALPDVLTGQYRENWDTLQQEMLDAGVPAELARRLAGVPILNSAFDIAYLKRNTSLSLDGVAATYFHVGEALLIPWLFEGIAALDVQGRWQARARANLREDVYRLHRTVTGHVLATPGDDPDERMSGWQAAHSERIRFGLQRLHELQAGNVNDFAGLAVAVRELRDLSHLK